MNQIPDELNSALAELDFCIRFIEDAVYEGALKGRLDTESGLNIRAQILQAAHALTNIAEDLLT